MTTRIFLKTMGALGLVCSLSGFTDCGLYHTVTIPASDTTAPANFGGVYDVANTRWIIGPTLEENSTLRLTDLNQEVLAIAAGLDAGGIKKVEATYTGFVQCCSDNGDNTICGQTSHPNYNKKRVATQSGAAGDNVSNGSYTAIELTPKDVILDRCGEYHPASSFRIGWTVTSYDFKGNKTTSRGVTVDYDGEGN